jgi:hypothetical protein
MAGNSKRVFFLALLLGAVFLAAQFHSCVDLGPGTLGSHVCPVCSATGIAIATTSPIIAIVPAVNRLEVFTVTPAVPVVVFRSIAPRAPPAL